MRLHDSFPLNDESLKRSLWNGSVFNKSYSNSLVSVCARAGSKKKFLCCCSLAFLLKDVIAAWPERSYDSLKSERMTSCKPILAGGDMMLESSIWPWFKMNISNSSIGCHNHCWLLLPANLAFILIIKTPWSFCNGFDLKYKFPPAELWRTRTKVEGLMKHLVFEAHVILPSTKMIWMKIVLEFLLLLFGV